MNKDQEYVVWAFDAFSKNPSLESQGLRFLEGFLKNQPHVIQPVFLLNDFTPQPTKSHPSAQKGIQKIFKPLSSRKNLKSPIILDNVLPPLSLRRLAQALIQFARMQKASFIFLHSTTKKPLARFFIGSFCETLLFQSPISLLILNPHAPAPKRIQNIFFPSDLSNQSLKLFRKVLFRANKLQAKVTLYHKLADDSLIWDKKTKEKCLNSPEVKKFKKWADKFEVPLNVVVEKHPDHLTQRILKLSRKSHQLIALTTHTGRIGSFFVGSTPRQVVRMTTLPVWLIH